MSSSGDDGQLLTGSLAYYLVITAPEVPCVRLDRFRTVPLANPLGVRGVGEEGIVPAGPHRHALVRIVAPESSGGEEPLFSLPVRPEAVLRAWRRTSVLTSDEHLRFRRAS